MAGLAVALWAGPAGAALFQDVTSTRLDNGLRVIAVENHRAPIVTQMLWYRAGAADERHGRSGTAHVFEHMMFKGTEKHPGNAFSQIVNRLGGEQNAFTSYDYTAYYQTVAREHLGRMMALEADRMRNLRLREPDFRRERKVVLQERYQRVTNDPRARLGEMASASLHLHHPYGTPVIGWKSELESLGLADLRRYHDRWYHPGNAVLVVAGDVEAERAVELAREHYGGIPAGEVPARERVTEPPHAADQRVELASAQVNRPRLSIRTRAPSYRTAGEETTPYALQVLDEVLGGGPTSRLYRALVQDARVAVGAGSWYSAARWDDTTFGVHISPADGVTPSEAEDALRSELDAVTAGGVDPRAVAEAKTRLRAEAVYARDDIGTAPRVIGRALMVGQDLSDVQAWAERIRAVTAEDVNRAARRVLGEGHDVTAVLTPEESS